MAKVIDGSILEGGGQILRNAAALSCILKKDVTINNIRAGRNNPGLRPQHLCGLQLIRDLCNGKLDGGGVSSTEVTLRPGNLRSGTFTADTKTAGSTCLLIQAALPCLFFGNAPSKLTLKGGTNADMAPPIDYFTWVFKPIIHKMGVNFSAEIVRRGFFPKGGGVVQIEATPVKEITPIDMTDPGKVINVTGLAYVAGVLPNKIAHTMSRVARDMVYEQYKGIPIQIEAVKDSPDKAFGNGTGIIIVAETSTGCLFAGSALGKRGVPAEQVGHDAAQMLLNNLNHGGCVDEYLQDQLIIFMALAKGKSRVKCGPISLHTQTAIHIAESITEAKFTIKQLASASNIIECDGIGLKNSSL